MNQALQVAFGARERASQAGAHAIRNLNLPTGNDVDRLARRLRAVSERLEAVEDAHRSARAGDRGASPRAGIRASPEPRVRVEPRAPSRRARPFARRRRPAPRPRSGAARRPRRCPRPRGRTPSRRPSRRPSVKIVAASISTATAPRLSQASVRARGGPPRRAHRRRRDRSSRPAPAEAPPASPAASPAVSSGSGSAVSPAPSARLAPSSARASRTTTSSPWPSPGSRAPQVPTRTARLTPSPASSCRTIAALGPPIPVDWMLSGRPSGSRPCSPRGRGRGCSSAAR